jgi:hypothetical protein
LGGATPLSRFPEVPPAGRLPLAALLTGYGSRMLEDEWRARVDEERRDIQRKLGVEPPGT